MKLYKKYWGRICAAFMSMLLLLTTGCGKNTEDFEDGSFPVYFVSKSVSSVVMKEKELQGNNLEAQIDELVLLLSTEPEKLEYKAPLLMGFTFNGYRIEGEKLYLDMSAEYKSLPATSEILIRAALVRTFCGLDGIKYVAITIEGGQLYDSLGGVVGLMSAEQFIDNAGDEINAYEHVTLKLYFATADGTGLVATNRNMAYNTNISMEKLVVEQLIYGPGADVADMVYPVINPDTKAISVSVNDGICYVNFDSSFQTQIYNVSTDVAIYSLVNSLAELSNVNKVQISVNGETEVLFRESVSLTTVFERNLDLVVTPSASAGSSDSEEK